MKERLFYIMLGCFMLWLTSLGLFVWYVLRMGLDNVDPALTLLGGAGAGLVTQFFLMILLLSWQFWFRKEPKKANTPAN